MTNTDRVNIKRIRRAILLAPAPPPKPFKHDTEQDTLLVSCGKLALLAVFVFSSVFAITLAAAIAETFK